MEPLHFLAATAELVVGLMAGNELAVAVFFHPTLYRLPDAVHTQAAKTLAKRLGAGMPFWYAVSAALSLALAACLRPVDKLSAVLVSAAALLLLVSILCTVGFLVPINNRIAAWDLERLPDNWKHDRQTWDARHRVRVAGLILAFGLLVSGLIALPNGG